MAFTIQYHPFFLNPALSDDEPVDKEAYLLKKFGREKLEIVKKMVGARAREEGLEL